MNREQQEATALAFETVANVMRWALLSYEAAQAGKGSPEQVQATVEKIASAVGIAEDDWRRARGQS